jgi:hypothetical protein
MKVPIKKGEIPHEFHQLIGDIKNISFPKQGCTSSVAIVISEKGKFVLKKCVQELYRKWLSQESKVQEGELQNIKGELKYPKSFFS